MSDVKIPSGGTTSVPFPQGSYDVAVSVPPQPTVTLVSDIGPPGSSIVWRGAWSAGTAYNVQDAVSHVGSNAIVSSYICLQANTGQAPAEGTSTAYWGMLAQEGATGTQGLQGAPGAVGPPVPIYDECSDLTAWANHGGTGTLSIQTVADGSVVVGGKVIRAVGSVANFVRTPLMPFDPTVLYRVKFRARQFADGTPSLFYAGLEGVAADGTTPVSYIGTATHGSQHYVASNGTGLTVAAGWQEFVGYVKGYGTPNGTTVAAPSSFAPGKMHANTRYIRPVAMMNFSGGSGTTEMDLVSLEIVPEPVTPLPLYDECGSLTEWTQWTGGGVPTVVTSADPGVVGGKVISCVGHVGFVRAPLVAFDPNTLYRVRYRVRQTVDSAVGKATLWAGLEGVAADGVTLVNMVGQNFHTSQHISAANNVQLLAASGWQEFVAYIKGVAATGTSVPTTPFAPGKMHQNVRYIRPFVEVNQPGGLGTAEIDYVSLEIVPEPVTPLPLYDECGSLTEWASLGTGKAALGQVVDGTVTYGSKVITAVGTVSNLVRTPLVPFDPTALYRIKFRVRQKTDPTNGQSGFTAGVQGVAADGVTLVNRDGANAHSTQHYVATPGINITAGQGWQEFTGYIKGHAATGSNGPTTPSAPGQMHMLTRYIRPMVHMNMSTGDGTQELDYVSLEIVPPITATVFATAAARDLAIPSPTAGMQAYTADSKITWIWNSTAAQWTPPPGMCVFAGRQNAVQSIPNSTYTPMSFDVNLDRLKGLTGTLTEYTPGILGLYSARVTAVYASHATGQRHIAVQVDGATLNGGEAYVSANPGDNTIVMSANYSFFITGSLQKISVALRQTSGAALNTVVGAIRSSFSLDYHGPT